MSKPTPDDITKREASRVLDLLSGEDRESMEAWLHIERRHAAAKVEWVGMLFGFGLFGVIVGACCFMATGLYANIALGASEAHQHAARIQARCIEKVICEAD